MLVRGHSRIAAGGHPGVEWPCCAGASFELNTRPNTPSLHLGMQLIGANNIDTTKSAEQLFSDYRRSVH